jgi:hypothetical protein
MKVELQEIVDALEVQYEDHFNYLDRQTGQVEYLSRDMLRLVEEGGTIDEVLKWQRREFEVVQTLFADWDRFVKLPTKYDVHEWEIMRDFAESVEPERFSDDLEDAIHGPGAFRCFKSTLRRFRREQDWYDFKDEALRRIAIEWCEENGIEYTATRRRRIPSEI